MKGMQGAEGSWVMPVASIRRCADMLLVVQMSVRRSAVVYASIQAANERGQS